MVNISCDDVGNDGCDARVDAHGDCGVAHGERDGRLRGDDEQLSCAQLD
jgi:hypothetical protein